MAENDISWGFFIDHCPFQPHCNAHPNNFCVWPDTDSILAPLDFDFCYERKGFVSTVEGTPLYGKYDQSLFDCWVATETYELDKALSGEENMSNFEYGSKERSPISIFLWDCLVRGYRLGFQKQHEMIPRTPEMTFLVELAIAITDNENT